MNEVVDLLLDRDKASAIGQLTAFKLTRGLKWYQAARHLGVHPNTVDNWRSGKTDMPAWALVRIQRLMRPL